VRYGRRAKLEPGDGVVDLYEKTRAEGFGDEVQRRVMIGAYVLSAGYYDAYYLRAQKVRTLIKRDFEQVFEAGVDAILTPATPSAAFALGRGRRRRPDQDVSERRVHRDGEPRRPAGDLRAGAGGV
jgi:aspartyl-tRNA(Asn)/glutamyl-tRNA(Gln) amidotransferase subunit A